MRPLRVKFILPALTEATSPYWRPIKYSLFPPLDIQTPYPGTALFSRLQAQGRITTLDWDFYDTRHVVYRPARLTPEALKEGYDWAYREFYRWSSIARGAWSHGTLKHQAKHFFYAAGWKKFEPLWDAVIRARQLPWMTPLLEGVLSNVSATQADERHDVAPPQKVEARSSFW